MSRNKFYKFILKFKNFREMWINTGLNLFGGVAFLYSFMALAIVYSDKKIKMPSFILYSMNAFTSWLALGIVMLVIGMMLWAVYFNKSNWGKTK